MYFAVVVEEVVGTYFFHKYLILSILKSPSHIPTFLTQRWRWLRRWGIEGLILNENTCLGIRTCDLTHEFSWFLEFLQTSLLKELHRYFVEYWRPSETCKIDASNKMKYKVVKILGRLVFYTNSRLIVYLTAQLRCNIVE